MTINQPDPSKWRRAVKEPNVTGQFAYFDQLDIAASRKADEKCYKKIVVLWTQSSGESPGPPQPVKPHNQAEFVARFPDAWREFHGEEVPIDGTPLTEIGMNESEVMKFRLNGVLTVEQAATLSDAQCEAIGFGTRSKRKDAMAFLYKQKAEAAETVMSAAAQVLAEPSQAPRKRGRPSKADLAARENAA